MDSSRISTKKKDSKQADGNKKITKEEQLKRAVKLFISLIEPTSYEAISDDKLIELLEEKQISTDKQAKILSEIILRSVFDKNDVILSQLQAFISDDKLISKMIPDFVKECQRIEARKTEVSITPQENKEEEKKASGKKEFDAGKLYQTKLPASVLDKVIIYKMDHRSLSINEIAASMDEPQRTADLEISPYEQGPKNNERYLVSEPTLPTSSSSFFLLVTIQGNIKNLNSQKKKLEHIASLTNNVPIIVRSIYTNKSGEKEAKLFIFGPPKELKKGNLDNLSEWKLMKLLNVDKVDIALLSSEEKPSLIKIEELRPSIYVKIKEKMNTDRYKRGEEERKNAEECFGSVIVASPEMTGIVHDKMLNERIKRAHTLAEEGRLKYLKRSKQEYLLGVDEKSLIAAHSYYIYNKKIEDFAQRSTMNYNFNTLNILASLCFLFDPSINPNFDNKLKNFVSNRQYTFSLLRLERALDPEHTQELLSGNFEILVENGIVKTPDLKKQDCFANEEYIKKWNEEYRYSPDLIKNMLQRTIYIISGLQKQEMCGRFWPSSTDKDIVSDCVTLAHRYHIKLDPDHIPFEFKKIGMTPLMLAVHKNDPDLIKFLFEDCGADLEPVRKAIESKTIQTNECIKIYLANPEVMALNAARHCHLSIIQGAINKIDDLNLLTNMLQEVIQHHNEALSNKAAALIISRLGALDPSVSEDQYAESVLAAAAKTGLSRYNHWKKKLKVDELTLNYADHLMCAAYGGHLDLVQKILEISKILPTTDAIVQAIEENHLDVLDHLLKHFDNEKVRVLIDENNLLFKAVESRNIDILNLLLKFKPNINKQNDEEKEVPLQRAIHYKELGIIEILLKNGANPLEYKGDNFLTPAIHAYNLQDKRIMQALLKPLKSDQLVNIIKQLSNNHLESANALYEPILFLLKSGMNPNTIIIGNKTLLDTVGELQDSSKLTGVLIRYGAKTFSELENTNRLFASKREKPGDVTPNITLKF